jgi:uncharacterized protein (DUF2141 family)
MKMWFSLGLLVLAWCCSAGAKPIPLQNPSFEQPVVTALTSLSPGNLPGWEAGNWTYLDVRLGGTNGNQYIYMSNGWLMKTYPMLGQPNTTYILQADGFGFEADNKVHLELLCGGEAFGQDLPLTGGAWCTQSLMWTTPATIPANSDLTVEIMITGANGGDMYVDNVHLDVVEPIALQNPSFEQPAVTAVTYLTPGNLPGWDGNWSYLGVTPGGGTDGNQYIYLSGGWLIKTFPAIGQPNATYVLRVDGKGNEDVDKLHLELRCGGQEFGQDLQLTNGVWTTQSLVWTAPATIPANSDLTIVVQATWVNGGDMCIDNVRLTGDMDGYEYLWFDNLNSTTDPATIYNTAASTSMIYNNEYCNTSDPNQVARVQTYLDNANGRGMKVILSAKELLVKVRDGQRSWTDFTNYINQFKNHPALKGWYLADEPYDAGVSLSLCQSASTIIRQNSSKPIYMAFCNSDIDNSVPYNYRSTYDIMMYDRYPFEDDCGQFEGLEDEWFTILGIKLWVEKYGWKSRCEDAMDQAASAGKPFNNIIQSFGYVYGVISKRLPTYTEERFMCYWSILRGAQGLSLWMTDYMLWSSAIAGHPYPYSGTTWQTEVGVPVGQELKQLKDALKAGAISGGVSDNNSSIMCNVYRDPRTGKYHLVAVNDSDGSSNVTFTFNLPVTITTAVPQYGSGSHPTKTMSNNAFSDTLTAYEVHHYLLNP